MDEPVEKHSREWPQYTSLTLVPSERLLPSRLCLSASLLLSLLPVSLSNQLNSPGTAE